MNETDYLELSKYIHDNIIGWCGAGGRSLKHVGWSSSRNGNHLEIGSLFGASAIMAAMSKKLSNVDGIVYCIDPMDFDNHEPCSIRGGNITEEIALLMPEMFHDNVKKFGVEDRIVLIREKSDPFPAFFDGIEFSSCFIDGWHYGETPTNDTISCANIVDGVIILDDCMSYYPSVMKAFRHLVSMVDWQIVGFTDGVAIFEKNSNLCFDIFNYTSPHNDSESIKQWMRARKAKQDE